ncbi:hypothetical protein SAY86_020697 [Trapa natans]|uniref:Uncharacterized protein n=1 Tax=Trapa natans TaxID=22666 RepID=A0AAN7R7Y5_TRANT|nr:hypothetical protein SAY86_020697 [Trapa natans]
MYPEVKPSPEEAKKKPPRSASEDIDREYYDYNSPKTHALTGNAGKRKRMKEIKMHKGNKNA